MQQLATGHVDPDLESLPVALELRKLLRDIKNSHKIQPASFTLCSTNVCVFLILHDIRLA